VILFINKIITYQIFMFILFVLLCNVYNDLHLIELLNIEEKKLYLLTLIKMLKNVRLHKYAVKSEYFIQNLWAYLLNDSKILRSSLYC